jgi:predicted metal-dependent peptidase
MSYPDEVQLGKMLDQSRGEVFRDKNNAAFLGGIMCSLDFKWCEDEHPVKTAATDGKTVFWSKKDFMRCSKDERKWTLIHEIWHVARLHFVRGLGKIARLWNKACDIRINNDMIREGNKLPNNGYWLFDMSIDDNGILSEEQIYNMLLQKEDIGGKGQPNDMLPLPGDENQQKQAIAQQVTIVIQAVQIAKNSAKNGQAGNIPGGVAEYLKNLLAPVVPWRNELWMFMTDLTSADYSWSHRNRRYNHMYLPGLEDIPEGLEHIAFFVDTSASITDPAVERFNSELKYIWETLKPKKMTVIQFDTKIHNVRVFNEGDEFTDIKVYGRGGTSMVCVKEWIDEHKPTAALIFSDMECAPMEKPKINIPILFAVIPGNGIMPDFGRIIHIKD